MTPMAPVPARQIFIERPPRRTQTTGCTEVTEIKMNIALGVPGGLGGDVYSSTSLVGIVTAIVRTSSSENPASSRRCANIANPSATGGLIVWPRSVEITLRDTPDFRMFAKASSQGALFV